MKYLKHFIWLLSILFLLSGCFTENTPQAVTKAFWQSVISNDVNGVIEHSSLTEAETYDSFSQDWSNSSVTLGKIIIDANQASITTTLTSPGTPQAVTKKFETYLIQQNEEWLVDYERTKQAMRGDLLSNLFGQLSELGKNISDDLSQQLQLSTDEFSAEIEQFSKELEALANTINEQTTESIEKHAAKLRNSLDELASSIERALKEQEKKLSADDKRKLTKVINDLHRDSKNLQQANVENLIKGSKRFALAKIELESIDNAAIGQYKKQWREWAKKFEIDMQNLMHELTRSTPPRNGTAI